MASKYIDFHNHSQNAYDPEVIAFPTFRMGKEAIAPYLPAFWIGVHPWDCSEDIDFASNYNAVKGRIVGIGEIGLDFYYDSDNINLQESVFVKQLEFAISEGLPITVHCVRGYNRLIEILKGYSKLPKVVIHSFVGSLQIAHSLLDLGCYLSFSPMSFDSRKTLEVASQMPLERVLLESDVWQGDMKSVYGVFCANRTESADYIKDVIYNNFKIIIGECWIG